MSAECAASGCSLCANGMFAWRVNGLVLHPAAGGQWRGMWLQREDLGLSCLANLAESLEKRVDFRLQDTRLTPFRWKTVVFPRLHAGASVGERTARKGKWCNISDDRSTLAAGGGEWRCLERGAGTGARAAPLRSCRAIVA